MADNPHVGPDPVDAKPTHVREKTYKEPLIPKSYEDGLKGLPEKTAEAIVRQDMPAVVDAVKKRV